MYELLCGRTPLVPDKRVTDVRREFEGQPLAWLSAHVESPLVPLERYPEGVGLDPGLRELIVSALAKDPADRPANADEFAARLAWFLPVAMGGCKGAVGHLFEEEAESSSSHRRRFMLHPGDFRMGVGSCCEFSLGEDRIGWVWAVAHYQDAGRGDSAVSIELEAIRDDGFVRVDGRPVAGRVGLSEGALIELGSHRLRLARNAH